LVGSSANDAIGVHVVDALEGGAYVVRSPLWDRSSIVDAGAATWCPPTGCTGVVSVTNSLVGSTTTDWVGGQVTPLAGGSYVVVSSIWDNSGIVNAGAATWCPATGCSGAISAANSLVGLQPSDGIGFGAIEPLSNGAYTVGSPGWDSGSNIEVGALTWCPATGCIGAVSAANSLVGSTAQDRVGYNAVTPLDGGAYVVTSAEWDNGADLNAGATTWCPATGCTGPVSAANSLVGPANFVDVLPSGAYLVSSAYANVGAVTWCPPTGCVGVVSAANSLIGSTTGDGVGRVRLAVLDNGAYVVSSPTWDRGSVVDAGAVTWCPPTGCFGVVSVANSLVGSTPLDSVGSFYVNALPGGAYVVQSSLWDNGSAVDAGAVTWCPATGCTGAVSTANSMVGSTTDDSVGEFPIDVLEGGAYVFTSPDWDRGAVADAGAVTWCPATGCTGAVSAANSLVGSSDGDLVGSVLPLSHGSYVVISDAWDNGSLVDTGAATYVADGHNGVGPVSASNSIVGRVSGAGYGLVVSVSDDENAMAVGFITDNRVVLARLVTDFAPLVPARLLDTRPPGPGIATVDGQSLSGGALVGGSTFELQVAGRGGVPADAKAAALNVTVTDATGSGFVTVFPCGVARPNASSLNFTAGATRPNAVISKLGDGGKVCLFASTTTHLVVDVTGEFPAASSFTPVVPARLLDTRPAGPGIATADGQFLSQGVVAAGTTLQLQVAGRVDVPIDASAVALNVTVTEPSAAGFVTVFPCGVATPNASNLNFVAGDTVPNAVISKIGVGGKVCLFASATTHLIVDVNGVIPKVSGYTALVPARLLDTRPLGPGIATVDGQSLAGGTVSGGTTLELQVAGRGGVPAEAAAVVLNVTVTGASGPGFVTVYPCGVARPNASSLNYVVGDTVPNAVLSKLGTDGKVCLFASTTTHLVADVNGVL
jgi:hypothetical protein